MAIARARWAASSTSSNRLGTLSTQSSTVTRAIAAAPRGQKSIGKRRSCAPPRAFTRSWPVHATIGVLNQATAMQQPWAGRLAWTGWATVGATRVAGALHRCHQARSALTRTIPRRRAGLRASKSTADTPSTGWRQYGAMSASGTSTKPRRCIRGCGRTSGPPGRVGAGQFKTRPPWSMISRSSGLRLQRGLGRRPARRSISFRSAKQGTNRAVSAYHDDCIVEGWHQAGTSMRPCNGRPVNKLQC